MLKNFMNKNFTEKELETAIKKLKNKKATGIDQIPNKIIKNKMAIFWHGYNSLTMRIAIIKPLPKSKEKDPKIPLNYRGISLNYLQVFWMTDY